MKKIVIILISLFIGTAVFANSRLLKISYNKAVRYYKTGNYRASTIYLLDALKNRSINRRVILRSKVYLLLGKCYNLMNDFNKAEYYLYQLFRNTPINRYYKEGLLEIGKTYSLSKNYNKSIEVYKYIEQKFSDREFLSEAIFLSGEIYLLKGDKYSAVNQFRRVTWYYKNSKRYVDARMRLISLGYLKKTPGGYTGVPEKFKPIDNNRRITINNNGLTEEERRALLEAEKAKIREKERERLAEIARLKELERQKEIERQREILRQKELERQRKERERQKELERERKELERQRRELEKQKLISKQKELERQRQKEKEKERERQRELERERMSLKERELALKKELELQKEKLRQSELEKENAKQREAEKDKQLALLKKEKQAQIALLKREIERLKELERQRKLTQNTGNKNRGGNNGTPAEPNTGRKTQESIPDISFPSDRTYYPSDSGFARKLRYELLKGIKNLSVKDLRKLESRLRLLEKRERELTGLRRELMAFHKLLLTKDRLLSLKRSTLTELSRELQKKEERILLLMNLSKVMKKIKIKKSGE